MTKDQMDISDILGDHLASAPLLRTRTRKFDLLMVHFAIKGIPLVIAGDAKHLDRKPATMKKHARRLGLIFPDYKPREKAFADLEESDDE